MRNRSDVVRGLRLGTILVLVVLSAAGIYRVAKAPKAPAPAAAAVQPTPRFTPPIMKAAPPVATTATPERAPKQPVYRTAPAPKVIVVEVPQAPARETAVRSEADPAQPAAVSRPEPAQQTKATVTPVADKAAAEPAEIEFQAVRAQPSDAAPKRVVKAVGKFFRIGRQKENAEPAPLRKP